MRKVIAVVWILVLTVSILGAQRNFVNADNSEKTIFLDDFESYPVGQFPSSGGWSLVYDGKGEEYQKVITDIVRSGTKAFQMWSATGCWSSNAERKFVSNADIIGFELDVWAEDRGTMGCGEEKTSILGFGLWNKDLATWGKYYTNIYFAYDRKIYAWVRESGKIVAKSIGSWTPKKWYHFKVVVNRISNTYDVYIDGKLVASDLPTPYEDTENINALMIGSGHSGSRVVYDNVRVFEVASGSPSSSVDLSRGLVAYYSFDHCDARDDSGNGHDGEIYGNPKCVDGVVGKAFEFDGNDDYIELPTFDAIWEEGFSVCAWAKFERNKSGSYERIIDLGNGDGDTYGNNIWFGRFRTTNDIAVESWNGTHATLSRATTEGGGRLVAKNGISVGEFAFYCAVVDKYGHMAIYKNGILIAEKKGIPVANVVRKKNYIAHSNWPWFDPNFKGIIDEVHIYNRALSEEEIKNLYLAGAGSPSLPSREEATSEYKYVFPLVYLKPMWGTSWYGSGIEVYSLEDDTKIIIDTNFNGPDSNDPTYTLKAGDILYAGNFPDISNHQTFEWKQNPIIIYSTKPVAIDYRYLTADYGDYDDAGMRYGAPQPGTKLLGTNVRWLYITPTEKDADVYINGQYAGHINYGEVLLKKYDSPQTIVITSSSPVVAVSAYIDPSVRSRSYAFALTLPMSGKFLIPNSIKEYALKTNAVSVDEYYIIMDSRGNIIENQSLPAEPKVVSLTDSAVFVFRVFYYKDPWGGGASRYAMSAVAIKPPEESTLFGGIWPVSEHTVTHQVRFYAAGDVTVYMDTNGDGTIDSVKTLPAGQIYKFSDQETPVNKGTLIYVKGKLSGYSLLMGGWNGQIEGAEEMGTTLQLSATSSSIRGTLKISSEPSGAEVYVNDEYKGTTPLTLNLAPRTYTVKITKEGYEDYTTSVTLNSGESKELSATLNPKPTSTTTTTTLITQSEVSSGYMIGSEVVPGFKPSESYLKNVSAYAIQKAEELIANVTGMGYEINFADDYLREGKKAFDAGDYKKAKELALNAWITALLEWQIQYEAEILEKAGVDTTGIMEKYNSGDLDGAIELIHSLENELSGDYAKVFDSVDDTFESVKDYWDEGIRLWNYVGDLYTSNEKFKSGELNVAKNLADKALNVVRDVGEMAREVLRQLKELGDSIFQNGRGGEKAKELFERAMKLFDRGEFEQAKKVVVEIQEVVVVTTTKSGGGICGPGIILGLAMIPILIRRRAG